MLGNPPLEDRERNHVYSLTALKELMLLAGSKRSLRMINLDTGIYPLDLISNADYYLRFRGC